MCFRSHYYELHPLDEKNAQCLSHWKVKYIYKYMYVIKDHMFDDLYFVYVMHAITTLK